MITIVDYGMGNIGSIANMIKYLGGTSEITADIETIRSATKIILPGVGSFDFAMQKLKSLNLIDVLNEKALEEKIPILGICLGMQLLSNGSDEGTEGGLKWIDAQVIKFDESKEFRIPNMGWNYVKQEKKSQLFTYKDPETRFYFVHSYYMKCNQKKDILFTSNHGIDYTCAVEANNIYGVQFHPEKSHRFGKELLNNFLKLC